MRIVISGLGVMGASLAQAIKNSDYAAEIWGYDRKNIIDQALDLDIIDYPVSNWPDNCRDADLVFLATPIKVIKQHLDDLNQIISSNTIVTDIGSTKQELNSYTRKINFSGIYIGGHPMTGAEKNGIAASNPLLYENAIYILTTDSKHINKKIEVNLISVLKAIKARIFFMDAERHDKVMAMISHLPQLLAVALINYVGQENQKLQHCFNLAAGGFRDLTRIASSSSEIWQDIISTNKKNIELALESFIIQLEKEKNTLDDIKTTFSQANAFRTKIPTKNKGFLSPLTDVLVYVDDQKGVIAKISNALFKEDIDIRDIELLKIREHEGGVFMISFENEKKANEAINVLKSINYNAFIKE